jgi:hypothetical protein
VHGIIFIIVNVAGRGAALDAVNPLDAGPVIEVAIEA